MKAKTPTRKVLVTDYAWNSLAIEQEILGKVGAELIVAQKGSEDELAELAHDAEGILTCWKPVTRRVIEQAIKCQAIGRYGIGLDNIDVQCATTMGIVVTNVPAYCVDEVSEHAMALLLSCARKVPLYDKAAKSGTYDVRAGGPIYRIRGKTLGIVGFGKIGRAVYEKARGFGLTIVVHDSKVSASAVAAFGIEVVSFEELLNRSDYISIHLPLTSETVRLFNAEAFRRMKSTAFVINTSRGGVVDSLALLKALNDGQIAGAGLDVLAQEPPASDDPLVLHAGTIITPHAAFNSEESLQDLETTAATQMADLLSGKLPEFVVNPEVLEQTNLRAKLLRVPN
jgi:D-3-phosphoglycerate dehydrogenase / 2-oxoglutarate reductase